MNVLVAGDFCDQMRVKSILCDVEIQKLFRSIIESLQPHDLCVTNFEFPIVTPDASPIKKAGPLLGGNKDSALFLKKIGFNICTLANNHILDQGESCCLYTKKILETNGIKTVGAGANLQDASNILFYENNHESIGIINCCEHEFSIATDLSAGANPLNPIQQFYKIQEAKEKADYVLVIVHGGHEHCSLPSPRMRETYRFFIDAGADAVVNHHQHCYSGYEIYKNKPIFYGLGNFLFDWEKKRNCPWNEGYMVSLSFHKETAPSFSIYPYTQCNEKPIISMMRGEKEKEFYAQIQHLNEIIANDDLLFRSWSEWVKKNSGYFLLSFQPYNGRVTKGLFNRGLLPSFLNEKKRLGALNHIECESHLDRLKIVLKERL